jgi:hypothetical protein
MAVFHSGSPPRHRAVFAVCEVIVKPLRKSGIQNHVRYEAVMLGIKARHDGVVIGKCLGRKRRNQAVCSDAPGGESP